MVSVIDAVLEKLDKVRRCGNGWTARCPVHEDKNPSLSICERSGKLLVHCHAGCDYRDIFTALGIARNKPWIRTAEYQKRQHIKKAEQIIENWAEQTAMRVSLHMQEIGQRQRFAEMVLQEFPADVDVKLLTEEIRICRREWILLETLGDDLENPAAKLELWKSRHAVEGVVNARG